MLQHHFYTACLAVYITLNMRKPESGLGYALKLIASAAALVVIALGLASSSIFGGANALGVAMFLGLVFAIPAGALVVFGLLALATRPPHSEDAVGANYLQPSQVSGECPNCDAVIPLSATECPCCRAIFGAHSSWQVRKRRHLRPGAHA